MKRDDANAIAALRDELALLEAQILEAPDGRDASVETLKARHRGLLATLSDARRAEDRRVKALVSRLMVGEPHGRRSSVRRLEIPLR